MVTKISHMLYFVGRGSSVGVVSRYGLDGPGIETRWQRDFPHSSRPALGPTQPPIQRQEVSFPEVKRSGRGVDHPSLSSAEFKQIAELPLWVFKACSRAKFNSYAVFFSFCTIGIYWAKFGVSSFYCQGVTALILAGSPAAGIHVTVISIPICYKTKLNSVALVLERTMPTERPPPVGEVSANFCG